jgi:hypothetical protein
MSTTTGKDTSKMSLRELCRLKRELDKAMEAVAEVNTLSDEAVELLLTDPAPPCEPPAPLPYPDGKPTLDQFLAKQNTRWVKRKDGRSLGENGSWWEGDAALFAYQEPPTDPLDLLRARREYWQTVYDNERKEFMEFRADAMERANNAVRYRNVPAPENAVGELLAGRQRLDEYRGKLREIDAEIEKIVPRVPPGESRDEKELFHKQQVARQIALITPEGD